jgi:hypothetical protein
MKRQTKAGWAGFAGAAVLLLAGMGSARAQSGPPGPPPQPPGGFGMRGPGPMSPDDAMGFLGFESRMGGKTVTGAPFTADFTSVTTETLSDGNVVTRKTTGSLARDGQGRTRSEVTLPAIGQFATNGATPPHGIFINDPVAGTSYVLEADRKIAREEKMRKNNFRGAPGGGGPNGGGPRPNARNSANVTTQSLGTQMIGGIAAEGTRTVRTIPAGQIGNAKPIEISVERWYSSDLQMNVMIKRSDPRGGTTVYQLASVVRSEPDAALFQVPSDYTVKQGGGPRRGMRQGAGATPPPQQ